MNKRCTPQDRMARLRETGGTPKCETAMVKALYYLKDTQEAATAACHDLSCRRHRKSCALILFGLFYVKVYVQAQLLTMA
jgi:hypothetical protein